MREGNNEAAEKESFQPRHTPCLEKNTVECTKSWVPPRVTGFGYAMRLFSLRSMNFVGNKLINLFPLVLYISHF